MVVVGVGEVWQLKALMTLVLVLLLAGCAAGRGEAGRTLPEETTANGTEETTVYKEEMTVFIGAEGLPRPLDITLSYGGREVNGTLGSYCWSSGKSGVCADSFFIVPPRKKTLTVPSGSEVVFRFGGQTPPKKLGAAAYPLSKNDSSSASTDPSRSHSLKAYGSGVERTIPVELPPGEYVVDVFIQVPQTTSRDVNDATYYFRIMVE
jgi:hypothetical protein